MPLMCPGGRVGPLVFRVRSWALLWVGMSPGVDEELKGAYSTVRMVVGKAVSSYNQLLGLGCHRTVANQMLGVARSRH